MTLRALIKAGGVDYLASQAVENPGPFLGLLGRVLPREVHTELSGEVRIRQEVRRDLVEKLIVLIHGTPSSETGECAPARLPTLLHAPDTMLKGQVSQDRDGLSRRAENARRESAGAIAGAVHRAASMNAERSGTP